MHNWDTPLLLGNTIGNQLVKNRTCQNRFPPPATPQEAMTVTEQQSTSSRWSLIEFSRNVEEAACIEFDSNCLSKTTWLNSYSSLYADDAAMESSWCVVTGHMQQLLFSIYTKRTLLKLWDGRKLFNARSNWGALIKKTKNKKNRHEHNFNTELSAVGVPSKCYQVFILLILFP